MQQSNYSNDFWIDAKKACVDQGMKLPTVDEFHALYENPNSAEKITRGTSFWTAIDPISDSAVYVYDGSGNSINFKNVQNSVLCIGN